jgi:hypothetical protein
MRVLQFIISFLILLISSPKVFGVNFNDTQLKQYVFLVNKTLLGVNLSPDRVEMEVTKLKAQGIDTYLDNLTGDDRMYYSLIHGFADDLLDFTKNGARTVVPGETFAAVSYAIFNKHDFRKIFYENITAIFDDRANVDPLDINRPNRHYEAAIGNKASIAFTQAVPQLYHQNLDENSQITAFGIFSNSELGTRIFEDGTNRAPILAMNRALLCVDQIEQLKTTATTNIVRADVARTVAEGNPGGLEMFQLECASCHTWMDGIVNAFNHCDERNGRTVRCNENGNTVGKINANRTHQGAPRVSGVNWSNDLMIKNVFPEFGFAAASGIGPRSLLSSYANSEAFPQCLSQKFHNLICKENYDWRKGSPEEKAVLSKFAQLTKDSSFNIRLLIAKLTDYCTKKKVLKISQK